MTTDDKLNLEKNSFAVIEKVWQSFLMKALFGKSYSISLHKSIILCAVRAAYHLIFSTKFVGVVSI